MKTSTTQKMSLAEAELKYVWMATGEVFVMIHGTTKMLLLCADNWNSPQMVNDPSTLINNSC